MKNIIFIFILILTSCVTPNKNELKIITHTDGCCLSGGWSKISIDLKWNSKVTLSYNESKDRMNDIEIWNNNQLIKIDWQKIKEVRSSDFSTLNDIWINEFSKEINSFSFEFNNLKLNNKNNYGRYMIEFKFQNYNLNKIIYSQFDEETNNWIFLYEKKC